MRQSRSYGPAESGDLGDLEPPQLPERGDLGVLETPQRAAESGGLRVLEPPLRVVVVRVGARTEPSC